LVIVAAGLDNRIIRGDNRIINATCFYMLAGGLRGAFVFTSFKTLLLSKHVISPAKSGKTRSETCNRILFLCRLPLKEIEKKVFESDAWSAEVGPVGMGVPLLPFSHSFPVTVTVLLLYCYCYSAEKCKRTLKIIFVLCDCEIGQRSLTASFTSLSEILFAAG
jgi:hypothetical protein